MSLLCLDLLVHSVPGDCVDFAYDLLVDFKVQLVVVKDNNQPWVLSIHSLADGRLNFKVNLLDILADELKLVLLLNEVGLIGDSVEGAPL